VERVIVPERRHFPEGYLKGEWILRLTGRKNEGVLLMSIRTRKPYLTWSPGKGAKASQQATRSPFDLTLSKHLKGAKLLKIEALPRERTAVLWFSEEGQSQNRMGLVLVFIPAAPEAYLVSVPEKSQPTQWPIIARSRTIRDPAREEKFFTPPDGTQAPPNPVVREELFRKPENYSKEIEQSLRQEAFDLRLLNAQKNLRHLLKQAKDRLRQSETAHREAQAEENWQRLGDLLKSALGNPPPLQDSARLVHDYETDQEVSIPCDPRLSIQEQVEKFYHNSRRKQRRLQEAQGRIDRFRESISHLESALNQKLTSEDWPSLERLERLAGISSAAPLSKNGPAPGKKNAATAWLGKSFQSKDGFIILVGRNKDENLELTFKHARGNDIWMHVRGRPGAHVVIPLQPGKSAPLETLLDAAHLVIYYSGGQNWGKTEVDYTFKKYVKRIKDSTEASYINNKTLLIQLNPERMKKLLDQQG
jgi:predicted ribosome quality control (RQC) complex YloA/Tae2 family protein